MISFGSFHSAGFILRKEFLHLSCKGDLQFFNVAIDWEKKIGITERPEKRNARFKTIRLELEFISYFLLIHLEHNNSLWSYSKLGTNLIKKNPVSTW